MRATQLIILVILTVAIPLSGGLAPELGHAQMGPGSRAPLFTLNDVYGRPHDLTSMSGRAMITLYFFDVTSQPSREGLVNMNRLSKKYGDDDFLVWGITVSNSDEVAQFVDSHDLGFPVLIDEGSVSEKYEAQFILPTVCVVGPGLGVLDYFQGGGKTTEVTLVRLAERQLQRNQTALAKAIGDEVIKANPENINAKTVQGYAALKEGNLEEAQASFEAVAAARGQGEILGKEGLAAVSAKKGDTQKALELAREVEQKAPERSYAHVIKGDVLYSQNKIAEAEQAYRTAADKPEAETFQKTAAYN